MVSVRLLRMLNWKRCGRKVPWRLGASDYLRRVCLPAYSSRIVERIFMKFYIGSFPKKKSTHYSFSQNQTKITDASHEHLHELKWAEVTGWESPRRGSPITLGILHDYVITVSHRYQKPAHAKIIYPRCLTLRAPFARIIGSITVTRYLCPEDNDPNTISAFTEKVWRKPRSPVRMDGIWARVVRGSCWMLCS
jgi:hypothetical protein